MTYRHRPLAIVVLGIFALGTLAAMFTGVLRGCAPERGVDEARPVTAAEAARLSTVRVKNRAAGPVGLLGVISPGEGEVRLAGWLDWGGRIAYVAARRGGTAQVDSLMQARPGLIAIRDRPVADAKLGRPPAVPPTDGWQVRPWQLAATNPSAIDTFFAVLLGNSAEQPDSVDAIAQRGRWLGRELVAGAETDIIQAPQLGYLAAPGNGMPGPRVSTSTTPDTGGDVTYWVDGSSRLRRLQATIARGVVARVDFVLDEKPTIVALESLGGRPVRPRPVTVAEAKMLSLVRQNDRGFGGGAVTVALPLTEGGSASAQGWLDWRAQTIYLRVRDPHGEGLFRADPTGIATAGAPEVAGTKPPIPAPRKGWTAATWSARIGSRQATDLDLLANAALSMTSRMADDREELSRLSSWLRADVLRGVPVTVFEIRLPSEETLPGAGRLRYWIDAHGVVRRVEMRTRTGGYAQLDITPAKVPYLPR